MRFWTVSVRLDKSAAVLGRTRPSSDNSIQTKLSEQVRALVGLGGLVPRILGNELFLFTRARAFQNGLGARALLYGKHSFLLVRPDAAVAFDQRHFVDLDIGPDRLAVLAILDLDPGCRLRRGTWRWPVWRQSPPCPSRKSRGTGPCRSPRAPHSEPRAPSAGAVSEAALFAQKARDPSGPCRFKRFQRIPAPRYQSAGAARSASPWRIVLSTEVVLTPQKWPPRWDRRYQESVRLSP